MVQVVTHLAGGQVPKVLPPPGQQFNLLSPSLVGKTGWFLSSTSLQTTAKARVTAGLILLLVPVFTPRMNCLSYRQTDPVPPEQVGWRPVVLVCWFSQALDLTQHHVG